MLSYDDKHPKGTKYRPDELRLHRDSWTAKAGAAQPANYTDEHRKLDQSLFKRILRLLPWNGSIGFISTNNFAGFSFDLRALCELEEFDVRKEDPGWEFIDTTLEIIRATLAQHIRSFLGLLRQNSFPINIPNHCSVPEEWETERPEHFARVVNDIHEAASQCVASYKALIREGRHRLAIEVPLPDVPAVESKD
jgi:hypothetical protein